MNTHADLHTSYKKVYPLHLMDDAVDLDVGHTVIERNEIEPTPLALVKVSNSSHKKDKTKSEDKTSKY